MRVGRDGHDLPGPTGIARGVPTQLLHRSPIPTARSTPIRARSRYLPAASLHGAPSVAPERVHAAALWETLINALVTI